MGCGPSKPDPNAPVASVGAAIPIEEDIEGGEGQFERMAEMKEGKRGGEPNPDELGGQDELGIGVDEAKKEEFQSVKPWLGAICSPTGYKKPPGQDEAPLKHLELEFVYGYRSRDVRNNLFYTRDGSIVYCIAALGVVYDPKSHTQKFFTGHDDDVMCVAYHAGRNLVATGQVGKKPKLCVWDASTMTPVATFEGMHTRAVVAVAFSKSGNLVFSVGLDDEHCVAVHNLSSQALVGKDKGGVDRIFGVEGSSTNEEEFVTVGKSHVVFWECAGGTLSKKKGIFGSYPRTTALAAACLPDGNVWTAQSDGKIYVWNDQNIKKVIDGHDGSVNSLNKIQSGDGTVSMVVSGGRDGKAKAWNISNYSVSATVDVNSLVVAKATAFNSVRAVDVNMETKKMLVGTLCGQIVESNYSTNSSANILLDGHFGDLKDKGYYGELWGLATDPTKNTVFATGGEDGTVRMWDMATRKTLRIGNVGAPVMCVGMSPDGNWLGVGCKNGMVKVYAADSFHEGTPVWTKTDSRMQISQVVYSPDSSLVAVASHDMRVYVYDAKNGSSVAICRKNTAGVTHLDFSDDGKWIQTNSLSYELLYFDPKTGAHNAQSSSLRDAKWSQWTCILGWPVQGIWPNYSDGSDVNSVCQSHGGDIVATGEDTGLVKLFRSPCLGSGFNRMGKLTYRPRSNVGAGHSEHVTNVRFSSDDSHLISTGGADNAILQWRVVG
jgi:microtubule-associated protein-like 6